MRILNFFDSIVLFHTLGPNVHFVVMASYSPFVLCAIPNSFCLHHLSYSKIKKIGCQRCPYLRLNMRMQIEKYFGPIILFHTLGPYVHFVVMASCSPFVSWTKDQEFVGMLNVHKVHIVSVGLLPTYQVPSDPWKIYGWRSNM